MLFYAFNHRQNLKNATSYGELKHTTGSVEFKGAFATERKSQSRSRGKRRANPD